MNTHAIAIQNAVQAADLAALVDRASTTLMQARSSAEVLQAKAEAGIAYDAAKRTARIAEAQGAHDDLIAAVRRSQADAAEIEAVAKRRLADEYTAGQARGEVAGRGKPVNIPDRNNKPATAAELRISPKDVHSGRLVSEAEAASPGIVRQSLTAMVEKGVEPTRAALGRALVQAVGRAAPKPKREPGASFVRFIELADELDGLRVGDLLADAGPQRSQLGQRASGVADLMEDIMRGCDR